MDRESFGKIVRDYISVLEENRVVNWSKEIVSKHNSKLYALWNRSAGDCLLDSALQVTSI
jgi:ubiquitin thioesterase ZRANB1